MASRMCVLPAGAIDVDQMLLYVDGQLETMVTTSSEQLILDL